MPKLNKYITFSPYKKLVIGDVVEFIAKSAEDGMTELKISKGNKTTLFRTGHVRMISPSMVVSEILAENDKPKFDENTGKKLPHIKIKCEWFSHKSCQFHERWLEISLLKKCAIPHKEASDLAVNDVVMLRTASKGNIQSESILKHILKEETSNTKYSIKQTFDTSMYLPPKMVITKIEDNTDTKPIYDKNRGYKKREIAKEIAHCIWYNPILGKYSPSKFPLETLMKADSMNLEAIYEQFNLDDTE